MVWCEIGMYFFRRASHHFMPNRASLHANGRGARSMVIIARSSLSLSNIVKQLLGAQPRLVLTCSNASQNRPSLLFMN